MGRAFEVRKSAMLKTGLAKAKIYSRHSKEIYLAAKNGADPESNLALRRAIEKSKKDNVPADVIKRAIEKANSGAGEDYKLKMYEGFGPDGSTIIVSCLTDNDNRTISEVKNCFTKTGNKIGVSGAVSHMYDNVGVMDVKIDNDEEILELLIENNLDIKEIESEDGITSIICNIIDFISVRDCLVNKYGNELVENDEITWLSNIEVSLENDSHESFQKMIDMLNEVDDVQNIYHNVVNL